MSIQTSISHVSAIVMREDLTQDPGFEFWVKKSHFSTLKQAILRIGKNDGLIEAGFETEEILRIEAGILRYGVDYDENLTLPETGLDEIAASETKGCYPGQEVVARTKTYGGLKRKIMRLTLKGKTLLKKSEKIYCGEKEFGALTSICISPNFKNWVALGQISKEFWNSLSSEGLFIRTVDGSLEARGCALNTVFKQ
jgi:folate-binding protein YgfZ